MIIHYDSINTENAIILCFVVKYKMYHIPFMPTKVFKADSIKDN